MARSKILLVAVVHLFLFVFALSANAQFTSRYTSIAEKSCRKIKLTKADEGVICIAAARERRVISSTFSAAKNMSTCR